jgi:nucleoside-diphosphate-sugar epimerase
VAQDDLVPHLLDADALIHLAWLFQPTHDPVVTWRSNVEGSIRVFDAAVEAGVPTIVYASSVGAHSPGPKGLGGRRDLAHPRPAGRPPDTSGSSMSAIRSAWASISRSDQA